MKKDQKPYIVFETATDWDGNKIAILGRFHKGDQVTISTDFLRHVSEVNPLLAAKLAGVQTIDYCHRQYTMTVPPRYWESGLAQYTVSGCSWLIPDDQLAPATGEDKRNEILTRINREIGRHFEAHYDDVQPVLQMAVWRELPDHESVTDAEIQLTLERVIARKLGVEMKGAVL